MKRVLADGLRFVLSRRVLKRNLLVALVVGCVLSLANQFDVIPREPFTAPLAVKLFFDYLIPFIVSSASAAVNREGERGSTPTRSIQGCSW